MCLWLITSLTYDRIIHFRTINKSPTNNRHKYTINSYIIEYIQNKFSWDVSCPFPEQFNFCENSFAEWRARNFYVVRVRQDIREENWEFKKKHTKQQKQQQLLIEKKEHVRNTYRTSGAVKKVTETRVLPS